MVYVLDKDGNPLMPTRRYGKVRHLLKEGKAVVVRRDPFTIRLTYNSGRHKQPVSLGVDAGSKHIGLSATTEKKGVFKFLGGFCKKKRWSLLSELYKKKGGRITSSEIDKA